VTGLTVARAVPVDPANVSERVAPTQVLGIADTLTPLTTPPLEFHETLIPLSEPQEFTAAVPPITRAEPGIVLAADAAVGTARIPARQALRPTAYRIGVIR
jgi:hypothetical protein